MITDNTPKFIIGDLADELQANAYFRYVSHRDDDSFRLIRFNDLDNLSSSISGEYYWLFTLKRTLYSMGYLPKSITVALSDMFTLNSDIGRCFSNNDHYKYLTHQDIEKTNLNSLTCPKIGYDWLIGQPLFFGNNNTLVDQYRECHYLDDLLRFVADSIEVSLNQEYVLPFLKSEFIFPYPGIGTFETKPFFRILDLLENIAFRYIYGGWKKRTGYQQMNIRFLLERLHSFLLTVHLEKIGLLNNENIFGYKTILTEHDVYQAH
jgi:hypothetical protein